MLTLKNVLLAAALSTGAAAVALAPAAAHACDGMKKDSEKQAEKAKKESKEAGDKKS